MPRIISDVERLQLVELFKENHIPPPVGFSRPRPAASGPDPNELRIPVAYIKHIAHTFGLRPTRSHLIPVEVRYGLDGISLSCLVDFLQSLPYPPPGMNPRKRKSEAPAAASISEGDERNQSLSASNNGPAAQFRVFDATGSGFVHYDMLLEALTTFGDGMPIDDAKELLKLAPVVTGDGYIDYQKFFDAVLPPPLPEPRSPAAEAKDVSQRSSVSHQVPETPNPVPVLIVAPAGEATEAPKEEAPVDAKKEQSAPTTGPTANAEVTSEPRAATPPPAPAPTNDATADSEPPKDSDPAEAPSAQTEPVKADPEPAENATTETEVTPSTAPPPEPAPEPAVSQPEVHPASPSEAAASELKEPATSSEQQIASDNTAPTQATQGQDVPPPASKEPVAPKTAVVEDVVETEQPEVAPQAAQEEVVEEKVEDDGGRVPAPVVERTLPPVDIPLGMVSTQAPAGAQFFHAFLLWSQMVFILKTKLKTLPPERVSKAMQDFVTCWLPDSFYTTQEWLVLRFVQDADTARDALYKVVLNTGMKMNEASMEKLYDLMSMSSKLHLMACRAPYELVETCLNNLELLRSDFEDTPAAAALEMSVKELQKYHEALPVGAYFDIRHALLNVWGDRRSKVALFMQRKMQTTSGNMVIPRGGVAPNVPPPMTVGTIKYYSSANTKGSAGEVESMDKFAHPDAAICRIVARVPRPFDRAARTALLGKVNLFDQPDAPSPSSSTSSGAPSPTPAGKAPPAK